VQAVHAHHAERMARIVQAVQVGRHDHGRSRATHRNITRTFPTQKSRLWGGCSLFDRLAWVGGERAGRVLVSPIRGRASEITPYLVRGCIT
jgi:hypothetical protein